MLVIVNIFEEIKITQRMSNFLALKRKKILS